MKDCTSWDYTITTITTTTTTTTTTILLLLLYPTIKHVKPAIKQTRN
jgi:hypothetical protein